MNYINFDKYKSYKDFISLQPFDIRKINKERVNKYNIKTQSGLSFNFAASPIDDKHLELFKNIVKEGELLEKYSLLLSGEMMNTGEKRLVLHQLLRGNVLSKKVVADGEDKEAFYNEQKKRCFDFATKIREGKIKGSTGKNFENVVQIGIGGSDLGPRAMCIALGAYAIKNSLDVIKPFFVSNVDPSDAISLVNKIDVEKTLFILVSKSGTTLETLQNNELVSLLAKDSVKTPGFNFKKHIVAVTSATSPLAKTKDVLDAFYIDDYIGGRYSSTSPVGILIMSIAYGVKCAEDFLKGAHLSDVNAMEKDLLKNISLLDALIGVYERNALNMPSLAVLPYSESLSRFSAHLEQLDMESNGKSVNRDGEKIDYLTGPVIFGESGTNGQHSFYQHLHQSPSVTPLEFIGFKNNSAIKESSASASLAKDSHIKLNANLIAQIVAFAKGAKNDNPNKNFEGGRPSSLIYADELTPHVLGALLAHFENKIMFQGLIWNLNSFDQEGVQLGKKLTTSILDKSTTDDSLIAYQSLLN